MELLNFNSDSNIDSDSYAWRYMNFTKIQDLLLGNQLYFTRLDIFDDPLEGMPSDFRFKLHLRNISKKEEEADPLRKIIQERKDDFIISKEQINGWQGGIFASCWYLTEGKHEHHESLAMWNIYADKNCFALKLPFSELLAFIKKAVGEFKDTEIVEAGYGKVAYLNLYEYSQKSLSTEGRIYPSLIKDKSYRHENEVRFLLLRKNVMDEKNNRSGIKIPFKTKISTIAPKVEILCHPDMEVSIFNLFKSKFFEMGYKIKYSELLTRGVVNSLLDGESQ